jgi:single-strand DNA-binding protein
MYNRVILMGNLTRDIELKHTSTGTVVAKSGLATNRRFKASDGSQKEEVMFIDLTFFGRTAEIAGQYLSKGRRILIEGRLVLNQWTAQDGSKRSRHSIMVETMKMLGSRVEEIVARQQNHGTHHEKPFVSSTNLDNSPEPPRFQIDENEVPF